MRKFLLILFVAFAFVFTSCEKEADVYYVKYEANVDLRNEDEFTVTYTGIDGRPQYYISTSDNPFSVTVGPLAKGFETNFCVFLSKHSTQTDTGSLYGFLSVSKNNGPFALVKQIGGRYILSTENLVYHVGE